MKTTGAGGVAAVDTCPNGDGPERVELDRAGETAIVECVTRPAGVALATTRVTAMDAIPPAPEWIVVRNPSGKIAAKLRDGDVGEVGSPVTAVHVAVATQPIAVDILDAEGTVIGSLELDQDESVNVDVTGSFPNEEVHIDVVNGTVMVTVHGFTTTLSTGASGLFTPDMDGDGVPNGGDNCQLTANADQANNDDDALGNACDPDDDNDGYLDETDECSLDEGPINGCPFEAGGQNAVVNGFLRYASPAANSTDLPAGTGSFDVVIYYGSTILPATFEATLNGTPFFGFNPVQGAKERVTVPLSSGRTVLVLHVAGVTPTGRTAAEADRLVFLVP